MPSSTFSTKPPVTANMRTDSAKKTNLSKYVAIFAGGLIIGILAGWGITASRNGSNPAAMATSTDTSAQTAASSDTSMDQTAATAVTQTTTTQDNTAASGVDLGTGSSGTITIPSPQAAGLEVSVSQANVTAPTWLVVYEDNNGVPGNALGAYLFTPQSQGGTTSGTIELLRGTTPGKTYFVGQALDDGDKKFSLDLDKPVRDSHGNPVLVQFTTN